MSFDWDEAKNRDTLERRGFGFEFAARISKVVCLNAKTCGATTESSGFSALVRSKAKSSWWFIPGAKTGGESSRLVEPAGGSVMSVVRRSAKRISQHEGRVDWTRIKSTTDREIAAQIASDPDTAPLLDEEWFRTARVVMPEAKVPVSIRVDREVLEWFKARGPRYQSRMNAVLKAYVAHQRNKPGFDPL